MPTVITNAIQSSTVTHKTAIEEIKTIDHVQKTKDALHSFAELQEGAHKMCIRLDKKNTNGTLSLSNGGTYVILRTCSGGFMFTFLFWFAACSQDLPITELHEGVIVTPALSVMNAKDGGCEIEGVQRDGQALELEVVKETDDVMIWTHDGVFFLLSGTARFHNGGEDFGVVITLSGEEDSCDMRVHGLSREMRCDDSGGEQQQKCLFLRSQ